MDLNEVKILIRSLLVSTNRPYTVIEIVRDFEKETGFPMPTYNFRNVHEFLRSLTDVIQFYGRAPNELIVSVDCKKSEHIASLVKRQGKLKYCHNTKSKIKLPSDSIEAAVQEKKNDSTTSFILDVRAEEEKYKQDYDADKKSTTETTVSSNCFVDDWLFREEEISDLKGENSSYVNFSCMETAENGDSSGDSSSLFSYASSRSSGYVNESLKVKLRCLMKKCSKGLWCSELPDCFKEYFNETLDFREYGYRSLIEMVMDLSDIFRQVRPNCGDWLLFDATEPESEEELAARNVSFTNIPQPVLKNVLDIISAKGNSGICVDEFLSCYNERVKSELNVGDYGFLSIYDFLERLNGEVLELHDVDNRTIIKPRVFNDQESNKFSSPATFEITPDDDIFLELFPRYVTPAGEKYCLLKAEEHFVAGQAVEVVVAEVWSPYRFFIQLKKFEQDLERLMSSLQLYYNDNCNKLKMPEPTIRTGQVCVSLYTVGSVPVWHRAVINRVVGDTIGVTLVDYGTYATVGREDLRFLHNDFFNFPAQSFLSKLYGIKQSNVGPWPITTNKRFLELVSVTDAEFYLNSMEPESSTLIGQLIANHSGDRYDVGEKLIEEGLAVFDEAIQGRSNFEIDVPIFDNISNFEELENEKICEANLKQNFTDWTSTELNIIRSCTSPVCNKIHGTENETAEDSGINDYLQRLQIGKWTEEKEILALAFKIMLNHTTVRNVAESDLEAGTLIVGVGIPIDLPNKGTLVNWLSNVQVMYKLPDNIKFFEPIITRDKKSIKNDFNGDLLYTAWNNTFTKHTLPEIGTFHRLICELEAMRADESAGLLEDVLQVLILELLKSSAFPRIDEDCQVVSGYINLLH